MVSTTAVLGIAAVAAGMVLTPGPNMIYLVSRTVAQGRAAGLVSLLGVAVGFFGYLLATAAGLTALFALVPFLYDLLRLLGAGYLLWLAGQALRGRGAVAFATRSVPPDPPRRLFLMGLLTNLLNPKIAMLYLSLLPQFIEPARGAVVVQGLVLGLVQITIAVSVNAVIVLAAGRIAGWLGRRPGWLRAQRWMMATVLGGLAVRLLVERGRPVPAG